MLTEVLEKDTVIFLVFNKNTTQLKLERANTWQTYMEERGEAGLSGDSERSGEHQSTEYFTVTSALSPEGEQAFTHWGQQLSDLGPSLAMCNTLVGIYKKIIGS